MRSEEIHSFEVGKFYRLEKCYDASSIRFIKVVDNGDHAFHHVHGDIIEISKLGVCFFEEAPLIFTPVIWLKKEITQEEFESVWAREKL